MVQQDLVSLREKEFSLTAVGWTVLVFGGRLYCVGFVVFGRGLNICYFFTHN